MPGNSIATSLGKVVANARVFSSHLWRLEARLKGVELKGKVQFQGRPLLSVAPGSRVTLCNGVSIASAVRANPLGLSQPSVLRALCGGAVLMIGPGVGLSGAVICAGARIEIGEQTIIGAGAMIIDTDFHSPCGEFGWQNDFAGNARPIVIGRGVFVGARAIILKGVTIGDRAVIGAGAVVTKNVPAQHVAVGNPARIFAATQKSELAGLA
jgi:acetyltransferase-like isoleucine patch superfamily enzyme